MTFNRRSVYNLIVEDGRTILLVNPHHMKAVAVGRQHRAGGVASNVAGASRGAMHAATLDGTTDPATLAGCPLGAKRDVLTQALSGRFSDHHRLLLTTHLARIDFLEGEIGRCNAAITARLRPFEEELNRLDTILGVDRLTAEVLLAEIGVAMSRFPTVGHLASWAGMCLGNHERAGKREGGKMRKGCKWLRRGRCGRPTARRGRSRRGARARPGATASWWCAGATRFS